MIGIYKITSPKNKIYIGQSVNIEQRFKSYTRLCVRTSQQILLYRSLKKYGVDKHKFEILEECLESDLNEKERYYQDLYSAVGKNGLNCRLTTASDRSGKLSEETKNKLKGKPCSAETRLKISRALKGKFEGNKNPFYGKTHTKETLQKIKNINKGNKYCVGRIISEETKIKIAEKSKGNKNCVGRFMSNDTRNKIAKSLLKKVINTETLEIYESYKHVAKEFNLSHNTLNKRLLGRLVNNTPYMYLEDYDKKQMLL